MDCLFGWLPGCLRACLPPVSVSPVSLEYLDLRPAAFWLPLACCSLAFWQPARVNYDATCGSSLINSGNLSLAGRRFSLLRSICLPAKLLSGGYFC